MVGINALAALLVAVAGVTAQHVHYKIPQVEYIVQSMTRDYGNWANYHGPTGTGLRPRPTHTKVPPRPSNVCSYWLENIQHQGVAAFNPDPSSYQVFRNVKDFGAIGDGITDDTAAIQRAISTQGRCAPGACQSSTTTPAIVYFPSGTYLVSSSIIDYYYTMLIGNPNCMPVLKPTANFTGFGVIDGDQYQAGGVLGFGSTNVFWRQIRNFVIDMTGVPHNQSVTGIHWPTAQATSIQNVLFQMSSNNGTQHQGIFIESGSGGFMGDLTFMGGLYGATFGNQQFTMRNLTFYDAVTAINQIWDWGWTYKSVSINNCSIGLSMTSGGRTAQSVGSVTFIDSTISNTPVGITTAHDLTSQPPTGGSLIVENVQLNNVPVAVQGNGQTTLLAGSTGSTTIVAWGQGHSYTPNGPNNFQGSIAPNNRPGSLLQSGGRFYERSKPQYENVPVDRFISARSSGAKGDGRTDDTTALQSAITMSARTGKILFIDHGDYLVTKTIYVPAGAKIVGESYPVILSSGQYFNDMNNPKPVVKVGRPGETGTIEWSDVIVSTKGQQQGAILIQYNLASYGTPAAMWDVHTRIGGFAGSDLQVYQCPTTPTVQTPPAPVKSECIAAFMSMHITKPATGLYMENVWLWTADHDLDEGNSTQITVYTGRGLYVESEKGNLWLYGTAVEHHALYEYQFANTQNVVMGQIQTETAYYQPNPNATIPFTPVASLNDPTFNGPFANASANNADGWGLRIISSHDILAYGAGLYSFFNNYSTACSANQAVACQSQIFSIEGSVSNVDVYNLNTVGTYCMIARDGQCLATAADNLNTFIDTIALFRS